MDLTMWAAHNAKERDLADWKELFKLASPGYEIKSVTNLSLIEATWRS